MLSHSLIVVFAFISSVLADKIFVTSPVTGGVPWVAGKPGEIQWEPVIESATPPFPKKIGIDLMYGDNNAATKAMTIVGKEVDPRAGSYRWEKVPSSLDPNPPGGGYFLRLGSVSDGYTYGSRFQIKGLTGESSSQDSSSNGQSSSSSSSDATSEESVSTSASPGQRTTADSDSTSERRTAPKRNSGTVRASSYCTSFAACSVTVLAAYFFF